MKYLFTFLITFHIFSFTLSAQEVVFQRVSELMPEGYNIEGQAFLEENAVGDLTLRLSEDFDTPPGPDVRILLSNSLSLSGSREIVNLSSINHFDGERSFDVSPDILLEDFEFILFFCVNFQQFWASGTFGEVTSPDGGGGSVFDCEQSRLSLPDGAISIDICPTDQVSDVIEFDNSLNALNNYAYLITDENDILQQVVNSNSFNFEGSTTATQRVHGIHFDGELIPAIGEDRLFTESTECFFHSFNTGFITIEKTGTCNNTFICEESLTATTDWMVSVDICPSDAQDDIIELRNNLFIPPGDNYAYLITDANEIVQQVVMDTFYNFEGSSIDEQRVYGIHYDGTLNPVIGQDRMQTSATGCFTHSGSNLFLTITKGACTAAFECQESLTATTDWATETDICTIDGAADWVILRNTLSVPAGLNYVYLLTDESEILQEVIFDSLYNFEGTGDATQRIYGLSFSGNLTPQIGQNRLNTEASDCFIHSGANLFLTINKTSACQTNSTRSAFLQEAISISPNPSEGRFAVSYDEVLDVQKIQIFDNSGRMIKEPTNFLDFEIANSGIYLVRFITKDNSITKKVVVQ